MKTKLTCDKTNIDDFAIDLIEEIVGINDFIENSEKKMEQLDDIIIRECYYNVIKTNCLLSLHKDDCGYIVIVDNWNVNNKKNNGVYFSKHYQKNDIVMVCKNHIRINKLKELELTF